MKRLCAMLATLLVLSVCRCVVPRVCSAWDKGESEIMELIQAHEKGRLLIGGNRFSTRDSMIKALYLAKTGDMENAMKIIGEIAKTQYADRRSPHYGNFPTLAGDKPPLDYNWSAFIGSYLAYFYQEYYKQLNDDARLRCKEIIRGAAIHRKKQAWNRPDTTNINILTAYFLLSAGKILEDNALRREGERFWEHFYHQSYTEGIREFNGLNYLSVHLYGLGFLVKHEEGTRIGKEATRLRNLILWNVVFRYNADLRQLAGPYDRTKEDSRMGNTFMPIQEYLFEGSRGKFPRPSIREKFSPIQLFLITLTAPQFPEKWVSAVIKGENLNKHYRERVRGNDKRFEQTTTYMTKKVALGSVSHSNVPYFPRQQSRPIIAHIASESTGLVAGEFRVLVQSKMQPGANVYVNSLQHRTSVLTEVLAGSEAPFLEVILEWQGGKIQLGSCKGDSLSGSWEGLPFKIMVEPGADITRACVPEGDIIRTIIRPRRSADGSFRLGLGLWFGESLQAVGKLGAPKVAVRDGGFQLKWQSPDGLLQMTRKSGDIQSSSSQIDGKEVAAYPIGFRIGEFVDHD
ncbi:MAG: hypothetical protein A4E58_03214 [Syntrophorhabdus sp. PtaB.Bin006]|nr:MAG: hypothetical protein A4E58_03214 [Syntrophorhabdus sp. PtaB.Bin006]